MNRVNYQRIENEWRYGDIAVLRSGKTYREKYKIGHGSNGKLYRVNRRAGKIEAKCQDPHVPMEQFILITRTMKDMDKKLGEL